MTNLHIGPIRMESSIWMNAMLKSKRAREGEELVKLTVFLAGMMAANRAQPKS
jgi:hypothetical protein